VAQGPLSLDPASLKNHYSSLCVTSTSTTCTVSKLDTQECSNLYRKGLTAAASLQQQPVKASTLQIRKGAVTELAEWLQTVNASGSKTLQTVIPEDMLVYFTQHRLPNHAGSAIITGERIAAPSSLAGIKSHLATEFELLGRTGDWDPATQQGNPMHSMQIRGMLRGDSNHAAEAGYERRGAVPLTEAEMHLLLSSMYNKFSSRTDSIQQLLMLRDGLLFGLLWQTCFRGFNAGGVRLGNIVLPTGGNAVAFLVPTRKLPAGAMLHLLPGTTKNRKGGHCSVTLTCDVLCFSTWLQLVTHHYAEAGQPVTNFITRPLAVGTKQFAEKSMTCSNAWACLTMYLKSLGMYTGQSVHSTRRGNMIHQQLHMQKSDKEIGDAAMCNEKSVKYYTDTHRPIRFRALQ